MGEPERRAYDDALWGPAQAAPADPDAAWEGRTWEDMGCSGSALHQVYGDAGINDGQEYPYAGLIEELTMVSSLVPEDDRVRAAADRWASCMADAGHRGLTEVGEGERRVFDMIAPATMAAYEDMPEDATTEQYEAAAAELQTRVAAFSQDEIELAVADATCRAEVGYDDVRTVVDLELQQRFYDEHEAELEEYAAYEESRRADRD